ncbi:Protein kinase-like domain [Apiospora arundinis]|uniref:Hmg box protein n=1 Tax=Apiospora arundinis TaxID=335852 RepID=A0ABR2J7T8_9PEZI
MPSFVGRIAVHRLAAGAVATSSARLVIAKQLGRVSCPLRASFVRAYATPGRPKKTDTASTAQSVGRSRKTAAGAAAPKKAAAKKTTTTKAPAKKAATSAKTPKAKKASPPPKKKKVLTDGQKAKLELTKARQEKAELKQKALFTEPKTLPYSPWTLYLTRMTAGSPATGTMSSRMSALATEFKALSHSETEELQRTVEANKFQNAASYKAWVESHTPIEIAEAQAARNLLRRKYNFPKANSTHKIRDDRQPKSPRSAYVYFFRARHGSGDYANLKSTEALKAIAQEWKGLPTTDRQPFDDLAAADLTRYKKQVVETLHREIKAPR